MRQMEVILPWNPSASWDILWVDFGVFKNQYLCLVHHSLNENTTQLNIDSVAHVVNAIVLHLVIWMDPKPIKPSYKY